MASKMELTSGHCAVKVPAVSLQPRVVGIGEILWDCLPSGRQLGGAPANFAYHAHALGAEALVVSCVGDDELGREIQGRLRGLGLRVGGIAVDPEHPTGTVSVALDAHGQPTYTIHEHVAWDHLLANPAALREIEVADAICFGSLAQRRPVSRATIRAALQSARGAALKIFDINLRQQFYSAALLDDSLRLANVLKLNGEELAVLAQLFTLTGSEQSMLEQLASRYRLIAVALTKGAEGSRLWLAGEVFDGPASHKPAVDSIGAGDSFTAALVLGLLAHDTPQRILVNAHSIASYVCSQPGATPLLPAELRGLFRTGRERAPLAPMSVEAHG